MLIPQPGLKTTSHATPRNATLLLLLTTILFTGCSTSHSASPFFMYSSPLLDGDMRAQRTQTPANYPTSTHNTSSNRHVYARQSPSKPGTSTRNPSAAQKLPTTAQPTLASSNSRATTSREISPALAHTGQAQPAHAADFVWSVYAANNITLPGEARSNIAVLYRSCREQGKISHNNPRIGDLAFFHNTFDANKDSRNNDWYTHVAMVEKTASAGQTALVGYQNQQIQRFRMNLEHVDASTLPDGTVANSELRPKSSEDAPFTRYLAGQLFAGYCSMPDKPKELNIIESWQSARK